MSGHSGALENHEPALVRGAPSAPSTRSRIGFGCRPLHLRLWCPSSLPLLAHVEDFFPACGPNTGSCWICFGGVGCSQCYIVTLGSNVIQSESQKTMSTRKSRQKERRLEWNRRERRYDWIAIYFEETIH